MRIVFLGIGFGFWLLASLVLAEDLTRSAAVDVSRTNAAWLRVAKEHFDAGRIDLALERLQDLLDSEPTFLPLDEASWENSHHAARRLLGSLSDEGLAKYEEKFGGVAQLQWDAAQWPFDFHAIRKVAEQYPMTKAGYDALRTTAMWLFDHGEFLPASAAYRTISEHPFSRQSMHAADATRWAAALAKIGLTEEAEQVAAQHGVDWKGLKINPRIEPSAVVLPSGDPLWEKELLLPKAAQALLEEIQTEFAEQGISPLANFSPVVVGDLVIARNPDRVSAMDRKRGKLRWQVRTPSHTVGLAQNRRMLDNPKLRERIWGQLALLSFADRNAGTLTSDGTRVFLNLTDFPLDPLSNRPPMQLLALDGVTGRELWRWPRVWKHAAEPPVFFFGPPTPLDGKLYVIGEERRELRLNVLSARTGDSLWSVPLAMTLWPVSKEPARRRCACPVVYRNGMLFCPTGAGAIAAVDPYSQQCRWVYRYSRDDAPIAHPSPWPPEGADPQSPQDPWGTGARDVCIVASEDVLLFLSPESHRLHAVSLVNGKPLWTLPLEDGLFLSDEANGRALLIGSQSVKFIGLERREIEKTLPIPAPGGRGVMISLADGAEYLLPLEAGGFLRIDMTHQSTARIDSASSHPWGNLVIDGETVLMQSMNRISRLAPMQRKD